MRGLIFVNILAAMIIHGGQIHAQEYKVNEIRNCQHEMRTVTFQSQVNFFMRSVQGWSDIGHQKILHFASSYSVDTVFLRL